MISSFKYEIKLLLNYTFYFNYKTGIALEIKWFIFLIFSIFCQENSQKNLSFILYYYQLSNCYLAEAIRKSFNIISLQHSKHLFYLIKLRCLFTNY